MHIPVQSMAELLTKVEELANQHGVQHVSRIAIRFGNESFISPDVFREHFQKISTGSVAEGCRLSLQFVDTLENPHEKDIILVDVSMS